MDIRDTCVYIYNLIVDFLRSFDYDRIWRSAVFYITLPLRLFLIAIAILIALLLALLQWILA